MDNRQVLWHFAAMLRLGRKYCVSLTWLTCVWLLPQAASAWSPDGVVPDNPHQPILEQDRGVTCSDWRRGTVNQLFSESSSSPCRLRGRVTIDPWPHSVAIGTPSRGALVHGEALLPNEFLTSRPGKRYGTRELVETIERAVAVVNATYPNTPVLHVGDLSRKNGGFFPPHVSHQSGCDVDIGYYLRKGHRPSGFTYTTPRTLDVARSWTLIRGFFETEAIVYIFSDKRLIPMLKEYAYREGLVPRETLDRWFRSGILRHLKGHADHLHIRIRAPDSVAAVKRLTEEIGRRAVRRMMTPVPIYTRIRSGDSLGRISARTRVSQKKLRRYNRLRGKSPRIYAGKKLIIGYRYPSVSLTPKSAKLSRSSSRPSRIRRANKQSVKPQGLTRNITSTKRKRRGEKKRHRPKFHIVKSGDNLSKLAHRYRVPTASLCASNRLVADCSWETIRKRPINLKIGQRLRIPKR